MVKKSVVGIAVWLALATSGAAAKTTKTVQVDCARGDSINTALANSAEEVVVEVVGLCREDVTIQRDNVTLVGSNPAVDGIEAVDGVFGRYAVHVRGAYNVVIENLQISNAAVGLRTDGAKLVEVRGCLLQLNGDRGAEIFGASDVRMVDTSLSDNGSVADRTGFGAWNRNSHLRCLRCTIRDNGRWGVFTDHSGETRLEDSEISGWRGVGGYPASLTSGIRTAVAATDWALFSVEADVTWQDGEIAGSILAAYRGIVDLYGATQTSQSRGANFIVEAGQLVAQPANGVPTTLVGDTFVENFSSAVLYGRGLSPGVVVENLNCQAADAVCYGDVTVTSSDCGTCPASP